MSYVGGMEFAQALINDDLEVYLVLTQITLSRLVRYFEANRHGIGEGDANTACERCLDRHIPGIYCRYGDGAIFPQ